jgi:tRNA(fMet)-specific endonuclease VapC
VSPGSRGPVVIDTGVFAARLTPSGSLLAARYRPVLEGRPAVISFVTVAELGYGARLAGWGPGRLRRLEYEIARAEIVWPDQPQASYVTGAVVAADGGRTAL